MPNSQLVRRHKFVRRDRGQRAYSLKHLTSGQEGHEVNSELRKPAVAQKLEDGSKADIPFQLRNIPTGLTLSGRLFQTLSS